MDSEDELADLKQAVNEFLDELENDDGFDELTPEIARAINRLRKLTA